LHETTISIIMKCNSNKGRLLLLLWRGVEQEKEFIICLACLILLILFPKYYKKDIYTHVL
jgi:hypothetical protein